MNSSGFSSGGFARASSSASGAETLPQSRSDTFLFDCLEVTMGWEFKNGSGEGFGWDRRTGARLRVPAPPDSTREEFGARSLLAVTMEAAGGRRAACCS